MSDSNFKNKLKGPINPKLKVGDRVFLLHMEDETMMPGLKGTVYSVSRDPFEEEGHYIYSVDWDNGRQLGLLSTIDKWKKIENIVDDELMTENSGDEFFNWSLSNRDVFKYFEYRKLFQFLVKLRASSIVNMYGASPYLYMGKERIAHEFVYKEPPDEETFEELLESANDAQRAMINGVIKYLEAKGKEVSVENVNRGVKQFAQKILMYYMMRFN